MTKAEDSKKQEKKTKKPFGSSAQVQTANVNVTRNAALVTERSKGRETR